MNRAALLLALSLGLWALILAASGRTSAAGATAFFAAVFAVAHVGAVMARRMDR